MAHDLTHIARRSQGQTGESERMLRDIAFVLQMTQKVKQAMRAEPACSSEWKAPQEEGGVLIPC